MRPSAIFGPVASSRLGRSLGLDLLGAKVCSYDCLYCEVGATVDKTLTRRPYVPAEELLRELAQWRDEHVALPLDHVTLGGMGEPCLNSDILEIIAGARELFPATPIAVLTNASMLQDPAVRCELFSADVVLPSMDALEPEAFKRINRPHPDIDLDAVARGLLDFRQEYAGRIYLEVLLAAGINDGPEHLERMREYVRRLQPERVDVTTLSRPGTSARAKAVDAGTLTIWREALGVAQGAQVMSEAGAQRARQGGPALQAAIRRSLLRRPQTAEQLAQALGADPADVTEALASLLDQGHIRQEGKPDDAAGIFYRSV